MSIFKDIIVHFAAAQFANLVAARAHFAIGKREGEVRRQHALQHCRIRTKEAFARITLKLENFLFRARSAPASIELCKESAALRDPRASS